MNKGKKKYMGVRSGITFKNGPQGLEYGKFYFLKAEQFKYLKTVITNSNKIWIGSVNKVWVVFMFLFRSNANAFHCLKTNDLSNNHKVISYGCETLSLSFSNEAKFKVF